MEMKEPVFQIVFEQASQPLLDGVAVSALCYPLPGTSSISSLQDSPLLCLTFSDTPPAPPDKIPRDCIAEGERGGRRSLLTRFNALARSLARSLTGVAAAAA